MNILHLVTGPIDGPTVADLKALCLAQAVGGHTVSVIADTDTELFGSMDVGKIRMGGIAGVMAPVRLAKRLDAMEGDTVVHAHSVKAATVALWARDLMRRRDVRVRVVLSADRALTERESLRLKTLDRLITPDVVPPGYPRQLIEHTDEDDTFRILWFGHITRESRLDALMRALEPLIGFNDWRLEIIGTGPSREVMPVVRLARGLGLAPLIDWRGEDADLDRVLARASLAVFPGAACERDIARAMWAGMPVLRDADTHALRTYMTDRAYCRRKGCEARIEANRKYDFDVFCKRILSVYKTLFD